MPEKDNIKIKEWIKKGYHAPVKLITLIKKAICSFIPSLSWRWLRPAHSAPVQALKIFRILLEYGICKEKEATEIMHLLYKHV